MAPLQKVEHRSFSYSTAIMRQESIYSPDALSHTGAIGLMQFIKGTGAKVSALLEEPSSRRTACTIQA